MAERAYLGTIPLSLLLVGCMPTWPQVTPDVAGTILLENRPLPGAEVYVLRWFRDRRCEESKIRAVTSDKGSFAIAGRHEFEISMPGDRIYRWGLCIHYRGEWFTGYSEAGMGFPSTKLQLSCELTAPAEESPREAYSRAPHVFGLCKAPEV